MKSVFSVTQPIHELSSAPTEPSIASTRQADLKEMTF